MIKIDVMEQRRQDYWSTVGKAVLAEIEGYLKTIGHLNGNPVIIPATEHPICRAAATGIINLVAKPAKLSDDFHPLRYEQSMKDYRAGTLHVQQTVLDNVQKFLVFLSENNAVELKNLLLCPPSDLRDKFMKIHSLFPIRSGDEEKIINMVFNYISCTRVAVEIKSFFRNPELVLACPYCNLHKVDYVEGEKGGTAEVHELDHFFDKADHPLLSYSLFNLVPSDTFCNKSYNKGQQTVTKQYHINPYEGGYVAALRFKPLQAGSQVVRLDLDIRIDQANPLFDKMFGDSGYIKDDTKSGNLNMFKIRARYNSAEVKKSASRYLKKIKDYSTSRRRMMSFFKRMGRDISLEAHKGWYEDAIPACFDQSNFNQDIHAKLYRDLHDHVFMTDKHWFNKDVRKLIETHQLVD